MLVPMSTVPPPSPGPSERFPLRPIELVAILAFWTVFALLSAAGGFLDPRGRSPVFPVAPIAVAFLVAYVWALTTPALFTLADRFGFDRGRGVRNAFVIFVLAIALSMCMDLLFAYARYSMLPMRRGPPELNLWTRASRFWFVNQFIIVAAILAAGYARHYFLRFQARREEAIRLKAQLADARLSALRSQLDPHFLFNTLHAVSALVERDPRGVRRMIARLSELLRMTLDGADDQEVPLRKELEYLERYLEIMQVRFQGRLVVDTQVEPGLDTALVPNLVLQPLVENAIKHGVSKIEGVGRIGVHAFRRDHRLVLSVRDNGPVQSEVDAVIQEGIGVRNTRERLIQLYGDEQSLRFDRPAEGGLLVEVSVPYHTQADHRVSGIRNDDPPTVSA